MFGVAAKYCRDAGFGRVGTVLFLLSLSDSKILLPDDGPEAAALLAEKLRLMVESEPFAGAGRITSSFGVAGLLPDEEFDGLCKRADQALYESKHQGRNRVTVA